MYWLLKSKTEFLNSLGRGATFKEISKAIVENIEIRIPDISCQEKAVSQFEAITEAARICQNELNILNESINARFVEMFGDPIINERGWQQISLLDSLETGRTVSYGIVQTGDDYENGTPVFRPIDIAGGHIPKREELKKQIP